MSGYYYNKQRADDIDNAIKEAINGPSKEVLIPAAEPKKGLAGTGRKSMD